MGYPDCGRRRVYSPVGRGREGHGMVWECLVSCAKTGAQGSLVK